MMGLPPNLVRNADGANYASAVALDEHMRARLFVVRITAQRRR
jgi:hypothetical protein